MDHDHNTNDSEGRLGAVDTSEACLEAELESRGSQGAEAWADEAVHSIQEGGQQALPLGLGSSIQEEGQQEKREVEGTWECHHRQRLGWGVKEGG